MQTYFEFEFERGDDAFMVEGIVEYVTRGDDYEEVFSEVDVYQYDPDEEDYSTRLSEGAVKTFFESVKSEVSERLADQAEASYEEWVERR